MKIFLYLDNTFLPRKASQPHAGHIIHVHPEPRWLSTTLGTLKTIPPLPPSCHSSAVNVGCVVVGKPHPSHPFIEPHPTIYEISRATRIFFFLIDEILVDEKNVYKMQRLIIHPTVYEHLWGILRVPRGFPKFPMEPPPPPLPNTWEQVPLIHSCYESIIT